MKKGGMDRSSWVAAGACFLLLLLYPKIVAHFYPPVPAKKEAAVEKTGVAATPAPVSTPAQVLTPKETLAPGSVNRAGAEQTVVLENPTLRVIFTTWGGGIREMVLLEHGTEGEGKVRLNLGSPDAIFELRGWTPPGEGLAWAVEKADGSEVIFSAPAQVGGEVVIRRTFRLTGEYDVSLVQEVENRGGGPLALPGYALSAGIGAPVHLRSEEEAYVGTGWFTSDGTYTTHKLPEFIDSHYPRVGPFRVQQSPFQIEPAHPSNLPSAKDDFRNSYEKTSRSVSSESLADRGLPPLKTFPEDPERSHAVHSTHRPWGFSPLRSDTIRPHSLHTGLTSPYVALSPQG